MRFLALFALACSPALVPAAPAPKAGPLRVLVVSSDKSGNWQLYLVHPGAGETKRLTNNAAADTYPVWSPDGKRIAFVSDRAGESNVRTDIFTMAADGTDVQQLTEKQRRCSDLRWSPDGSRIAFVSQPKDRDEIRLAEIATGKVAQLTPNNVRTRHPAWSLDGKKFSFSSENGIDQTYTMNADGSDWRALNGEAPGTDATWSPDGKSLAYIAHVAAQRSWKVFTINADGKSVKQLTDTEISADLAPPQWSPDGTMLAHNVYVDGVCQVAVVRVDGSGSKIITSRDRYGPPRWSPDGKWLSYARYDDKSGSSVLVVSDRDGQNAKDLIRGPHTPGAEWRPK